MPAFGAGFFLGTFSFSLGTCLREKFFGLLFRNLSPNNTLWGLVRTFIAIETFTIRTIIHPPENIRPSGKKNEVVPFVTPFSEAREDLVIRHQTHLDIW